MIEHEARFERERAMQPEGSVAAVYARAPEGHWEWDSFGTVTETMLRVLTLNGEGKDAIGYTARRDSHSAAKPANFLGRDA